MALQASCHCGNINIEAPELPSEITHCNCSVCRRYAALWAYYCPEEVSITFTDFESKCYIWGDREVEFHHCTVCGCLTHYITTEKCSSRITAINARMSDPEIISRIPIRDVDNASS